MSTVAVNGIVTAPVRRSATARLTNRMFECFCNSFFFFTAMITNEFKRMVTGDAMERMTTKIQANVVLSNSQVIAGICEQKNTDLLWVTFSVLLKSMLKCFYHTQN